MQGLFVSHDGQIAQPALFIVSAAAFEVLKTAGIKPAFTVGHSLGEYSALYAAGAFSLETGLELVKARGEAIQEASDKIPGTMAAVVGLERAQVEQICKDATAPAGSAAGERPTAPVPAPAAPPADGAPK